MFSTVGRLTALISVALRINQSSAQNVTFYEVSEETLSGSPALSASLAGGVSISVGGTNSDGGTTYVQVVAETSEVLVGPSTTITLISVPTTKTVTFVENASGLRANLEISGPSTTETIVQTCGFGSDGRGTCVETITYVTPTQVLSYSGNVVPGYTLPATHPSAAQGSEVLRNVFKPVILAAAVEVALFYL
ncbi:hypothetical protein K438DRAFT_1970963 [Mycena galopus ATCC 62051]|nr:hypothetical protein K438DRAFT_1970963 [Mycena galopus ATCC 62051]